MARFGARAVLDTCAEVLSLGVPPDPAEQCALRDLAVPLTFLGGRGVRPRLRHDDLVAAEQDHWPRVWALRALRYVWGEDLGPAVVAALDDPAWRVRETAALVAGVREVGGAADPAATLVDDDVPRVRVAALRALAAVGEHEHVPAVRAALEDSEPAVRGAARATVGRLETRLDLPHDRTDVSPPR